MIINRSFCKINISGSFLPAVDQWLNFYVKPIGFIPPFASINMNFAEILRSA